LSPVGNVFMAKNSEKSIWGEKQSSICRLL